MTNPSPPTRIVDFARNLLGFTLHPRQAAILDEIYRDHIRTAVLRLGRRSGKGRIAAIVCVYEATVNSAVHLAAVPAGERLTIALVASSQRQATIVGKYIRGFLERPALAPLVVRSTETEVELSNGITILCLPAHAAAVRGLATPVVVLDEMAHFLGRDQSPLDVGEIWAALVPGTAMFPEGKVLALSTPRWSVGAFYDLVQLAASNKYPDMRTWHESTAAMNPGVPASFLAAEAEKDPASARREWLAEWDSGIGAVYGAEFVRAAVRAQGDLTWRPDAGQYVIALDAGFVSDSTAALVAHREPSDGAIVVDRVLGWRGTKTQPVLMDVALDAVAALSAAYGGDCPCLIDQYAAQPIAQGLVQRGVRVIEQPWTNESKVLAATSVRRVMFTGKLSIPDHADLVSQLSSLEQRPMATGRVRIAAPAGGHDDYAMAALAAIAFLAIDTPAPAGATIAPDAGTLDSSAYMTAPERHADRPAGWGLLSRRRAEGIRRITSLGG